MVQKTKKVCIGTLQAHAKFQRNWIKFEILIFDPCFKKHTSIFLGDTLWVQNIQNINCHYEVGIVPKFGGPQVNIGATIASFLKGGHNVPPPGTSRVKTLGIPTWQKRFLVKFCIPDSFDEINAAIVTKSSTFWINDDMSTVSLMVITLSMTPSDYPRCILNVRGIGPCTQY